MQCNIKSEGYDDVGLAVNEKWSRSRSVVTAGMAHFKMDWLHSCFHSRQSKYLSCRCNESAVLNNHNMCSLIPSVQRSRKSSVLNLLRGRHWHFDNPSSRRLLYIGGRGKIQPSPALFSQLALCLKWPLFCCRPLHLMWTCKSVHLALLLLEKNPHFTIKCKKMCCQQWNITMWTHWCCSMNFTLLKAKQLKLHRVVHFKAFSPPARSAAWVRWWPAAESSACWWWSSRWWCATWSAGCPTEWRLCSRPLAPVTFWAQRPPSCRRCWPSSPPSSTRSFTYSWINRWAAESSLCLHLRLSCGLSVLAPHLHFEMEHPHKIITTVIVNWTNNCKHEQHRGGGSRVTSHHFVHFDKLFWNSSLKEANGFSACSLPGPAVTSSFQTNPTKPKCERLTCWVIRWKTAAGKYPACSIRVEVH